MAVTDDLAKGNILRQYRTWISKSLVHDSCNQYPDRDGRRYQSANRLCQLRQHPVRIWAYLLGAELDGHLVVISEAAAGNSELQNCHLPMIFLVIQRKKRELGRAADAVRSAKIPHGREIHVKLGLHFGSPKRSVRPGDLGHRFRLHDAVRYRRQKDE